MVKMHRFPLNMLKIVVIALYFCTLYSKSVYSYSLPQPKKCDSMDHHVTRSSFFRKGSIALIGTVSGTTLLKPRTFIANSVESTQDKLENISDEELKKIITADMVERSFLVSADLTRGIYDEKSIFTDEIDSYPMEKWITGTKKLFVAEGSRVNLVGDVSVTPEKVEFRFDEDLMFRIPFRPVVSLTGRVVLKRDTNTGLITDYREYWDQGVSAVLKTAKFNI